MCVAPTNFYRADDLNNVRATTWAKHIQWHGFTHKKQVYQASYCNDNGTHHRDQAVFMTMRKQIEDTQDCEERVWAKAWKAWGSSSPPSTHHARWGRTISQMAALLSSFNRISCIGLVEYNGIGRNFCISVWGWVSLWSAGTIHHWLATSYWRWLAACLIGATNCGLLGIHCTYLWLCHKGVSIMMKTYHNDISGDSLSPNGSRVCPTVPWHQWQLETIGTARRLQEILFALSNNFATLLPIIPFGHLCITRSPFG